MTTPAIFSGATADGCTSTNISRKNCLIMISERNILMPPPVEPVHDTTQLRNRIHIEANTGHSEKSSVTRPVVVAMEIVAKATCRRDSPKLS